MTEQLAPNLIVILLGLLVGSFLNVVIYRFDDWVSIIKTRSHCRGCQKTLAWYDLLPLLSFIQLRGRCRYCHQPISWQYPLVELATAGLFWLGFQYLLGFELSTFVFVVAAVFLALALCLLIVIFCQDIYDQMISDYLSYALIISALGLSLTLGDPFRDVVLGALVFGLPIILLVYPSRGRWMGEGDVKLALGLGLLVSYPQAVVGLALSFIGGGLVGTLLLLSGRAKIKSALPFAPFLILGALIALFWGPAIIDWYLGTINYGYF